jgi:uncharacterized protein
VNSWIVQLGGALPKDANKAQELERDCLQWALQRGSRSGRVAFQYAKDFVGRSP